MTATEAKHKAQDTIMNMAQNFGYAVSDDNTLTEAEKEQVFAAGLKELNRLRKLFGYEEKK